AIPGFGPVPVIVADGQLGHLNVKAAVPAARSSSRFPPLRRMGFPDSVPLRWVKVLLLWLKLPRLMIEPPRLVKDPPPEMAKPAPASTVNVPLLVVVVAGSFRVSTAAMSTVPLAPFVRLVRRLRMPPPPWTVFTWPALVRTTLLSFSRTTLYPLPASPRTIVPALVRLTMRSTQLLLAAMVITWPAPIPGCDPVPVRGYGGAFGLLMVNFAGPAPKSSSSLPPVSRIGFPDSLP